MRRPRIVLAAILCTLVPSLPASAADLRINGSTTVNPVVSAAARMLRDVHGLEILVDTLGGSSGGIAALADGQADLAMSSRPISDHDRSKHPRIDFRAFSVGFDAVALAVSRDVWEGGVRTLSAEQMRAIYEKRITHWSQVGGPDRRIVFFNKEPGRGTWEVFADWLYGDARNAPLVSFPEVGSNEEGRHKVASTRGALTQLSAAWADGVRVFALALVGEDGEPVAPSGQAIAAGSYPMSRPLLLVSDGALRPAERQLLDFLLGETGQSIVEEHGYLGIAAVEAGRGVETAALKRRPDRE